MKKLSFLFAMVFAVSMAMAQKTTWVTQSGFGNDANITQSSALPGGYDVNSIYAVQSGDWNKLNTLQQGKTNYLELTTNGNDNTAKMTQSTMETLPAGGVNDAFVTQGGARNKAELAQGEIPNAPGSYENSVNTAHATQSGISNTYILNQGMLSNGYSPDNKQYLTQSGYGNNADLNQRGMTNYSDIAQTITGTWNIANLDQNDAALPGAGYDKSVSSQTGTKNLIDIYQHGNPLLQQAESFQDGTANTTNIKQLSWGVEKVIATQDGISDILKVDQQN